MYKQLKKEVEVVSASGVAGGGLNWDNPVKNLLKVIQL
jgi:hypothetical protein